MMVIVGDGDGECSAIAASFGGSVSRVNRLFFQWSAAARHSYYICQMNWLNSCSGSATMK